MATDQPPKQDALLSSRSIASSRAATIRSVSDVVVPTVKSHANCNESCFTPAPESWVKMSLNKARRPSTFGSVEGVPSRSAEKAGLGGVEHKRHTQRECPSQHGSTHFKRRAP